MDLLKDITRELRGHDSSGRDDGCPGRAAATRAESARETGDATTPGDDSGGSEATDSAESNRPSRSENHVCSFCETEFDADRGACPECDAEIVFRGDR